MIKLPKTVAKHKKAQGRGMGSGKGSHTSGRGQKGQKSRGSVHILFEGMKMKKSLLKRLPKMRGKGKFHVNVKAIDIKIERLSDIPAGSTITTELLVKHGIVTAREAKIHGVKVIGIGKNEKKFKFEVSTPKRSQVAPEKKVKTV